MFLLELKDYFLGDVRLDTVIRIMKVCQASGYALTKETAEGVWERYSYDDFGDYRSWLDCKVYSDDEILEIVLKYTYEKGEI
jgi:hypothetical protein